MKVLIVDDDSTFLDLAENYLSREENLEIKTAESVGEAWNLLKGDSFDAVVSDYRMPAVDGLEFLNDVKDWDEDVTFMLITGKGDEEVAMKAVNKGVDHYIQKFDDPEVLFSVILDRLRRSVKERKIKEKVDFYEQFVDQDVKDRIRTAWSHLKNLKSVDSLEEGEEDIEKSLEVISEALDMLGEKSEIKDVEDHDDFEKRFISVLERSFGFTCWSEMQLESSLWDIYKDVGESKEKFMEISDLSSETQDALEKIQKGFGDLEIEKAKQRVKMRKSFFGTKPSDKLFRDLWEDEIVKLKIFKKMKTSVEEDLVKEIWNGDLGEFYEILEILIEKSKKKVEIFESLNDLFFSEEVSEPKPALDPRIHPSA